MDNTPFINYPGKIAITIGDLIKFNPDLVYVSWQIISIVFTLVLCLIVYNNFSNKLFAEYRINKILKNPLLFLIISISGIIVLRLPNLILNEQNSDESQWIVNAATWLNGAVLWKDLSGFTGGPLLYIPLSVMYYAGDGLNYASIRLFGLIFCIIPSLIFVFLTLKQFINREYASLLTLPMILFYSFTNSKDFIAYESELIPQLFIAISCYFFVSWQLKKTKLTLFLLSIILGCFPYAKLQAVPIALSIVVCVFIEIYFSKNKTMKQKVFSGFYFITGGLLPSGILLIYILKNKIFTDFINDYIYQNLAYTNTGLTYHISGFSKLLIPALLAIRTPELMALICSTFFCLGLCFFVLIKNRKEIFSSDKRRITYFIFITIASYFSVCIPGSYFYHYNTLLIIPLVILNGFMAGIAFHLIKENNSFEKFTITTLVLFSLTPLMVSLYNGNRGIDFIRNSGNYELSAVAKEISKYSIPNEKLAVWGWNNKFYVETGLTQGTIGANSFNEAKSSLQHDNSNLEKYISGLIKNQPVIFLDASKPVFKGFINQERLSHENFSLLNDFIKSNYTFINEINHKKIYVLNERLIRMGLL